MGTSAILLILSPPVIAAGMLRYRHDYRRYGKTTPLGVVLLLAAWFMPMGVLGFAIPFFAPPRTALQYAGYALMILGLTLSLVPLRAFSPKMVVGRDAPRLFSGGVYRFSRNPQYVTFAAFVLGYAMTGRALMAYAGVALYCIVAHLTARVEEEHLERQFGEAYRRYRAATPRYLFF
ncbi:MAG: methyltransferase [Gemmatimonadota bacterium]|jgi:protein-S-isoprenylcysteine O-methyltransferase Ste14